MTPPSPLKWMLRRFDHSSIYLMIAGTYTPLLYHLQSRTWAWSLAIVVWVGAITGVVLKVALPGHFDRLSIVVYLLLGWVAAIAAKPLIGSLPHATLVLLAVGGVLYSAGIIFYFWHSLNSERHSAFLCGCGSRLSLCSDCWLRCAHRSVSLFSLRLRWSTLAVRHR